VSVSHRDTKPPNVRQIASGERVGLAERLYRASYPIGFPLPEDAWTTLDASVRADWARVAEVAKLHIVTPLLVQLVWLGVPVPVAECAVKRAGLQRVPHEAAEGATT
jgi:hypothetical protein